VDLSRDQLAALAARAGEQLKEYRAHPGGRYTIGVAGGERLGVLVFATRHKAQVANAALDMLRAELDLPLPQVRAADPDGAAAGVPALLVSDMPGEPLDIVAGRIPDQQLYALGRRIGEAAYRIHRVACARYGALAGDDPLAADDERGYGLGRAAAALVAAEESGVLEDEDIAVARDWFDTNFAPSNARPALVSGGLAPAALLVRPAGNSWSLSSITRCDTAIGWSPAWEHALFFDAASESRFFSLRVGYGNAYDAATQRTYEQVRESALRPYRALLALERLAGLAPGNGEAARRRAVLMSLIGLETGMGTP
jgi:hypothetical protein